MQVNNQWKDFETLISFWNDDFNAVHTRPVASLMRRVHSQDLLVIKWKAWPPKTISLRYSVN